MKQQFGQCKPVSTLLRHLGWAQKHTTDSAGITPSYNVEEVAEYLKAVVNNTGSCDVWALEEYGGGRYPCETITLQVCWHDRVTTADINITNRQSRSRQGGVSWNRAFFSNSPLVDKQRLHALTTAARRMGSGRHPSSTRFWDDTPSGHETGRQWRGGSYRTVTTFPGLTIEIVLHNVNMPPKQPVAKTKGNKMKVLIRQETIRHDTIDEANEHLEGLSHLLGFHSGYVDASRRVVVTLHETSPVIDPSVLGTVHEPRLYARQSFVLVKDSK